MRLEHTEYVPDDLYAAARVSSFMEEGECGRWRLRHFTVTPDDVRRKELKIAFGTERNAEQIRMEMTRLVPAGDYITLARRMIDVEIRDLIWENFGFYPEDAPEWFSLDAILKDDAKWIPVMSDTPAEIMEHAAALNGAEGRVLVTGLGLGCLPHALLTKPEVTRIDIIEIDPQVIALTGKYLRDPRVHIHQGSAADINAVPADLSWDYAWHDIWTHISARNLVPSTAEHRIAYSTLRELWAPRVAGRQDAWAEDQAQEMARITAEKREAERQYQNELRGLSPDEATERVYMSIIRDKIIGLPIEQEVTPEMIAVIDPDGGLRRHIYDQFADPDFWTKWDARKGEGEDDPMGCPNELLEANHG